MKCEELDGLLLAAVEHERRRIGALLHESLCQTLAGVMIQFDVLSGRLANGQAVSLPDLTLAGDHIREAIDVTRSMVGNLRPVELEGSGLMEALGQMTDAAAKKMPCEYVCEKPVFLSDATAGLAFFRVAEEALANVQKHAEAKRVTVSLSQTPGALTLKVHDDGKGFLPANVNGSINGIDLMRRRARFVGATLEIQSAPEEGTVVSCSLPLAQ